MDESNKQLLHCENFLPTGKIRRSDWTYWYDILLLCKYLMHFRWSANEGVRKTCDERCDKRCNAWYFRQTTYQTYLFPLFTVVSVLNDCKNLSSRVFILPILYKLNFKMLSGSKFGKKKHYCLIIGKYCS